jgi:hypothetical protein
MSNDSKKLELGSQWYMGLAYHMQEAYKELPSTSRKGASSQPPYALFARKYYQEMRELNHEKKYDYCFIGSINSCRQKRQWVIEFAKKYFTEKSIFINTDNNDKWVSLGVFDLSNQGKGYCPKEQKDHQSKAVQYRTVEENKEYFESMCQSQFCLCPAGDSPWSFRFYEVLMCECIPVVESWHHTYRTKEESEIPYGYYLHSDYENHCFTTEMIQNNNDCFEKYHLLPVESL